MQQLANDSGDTVKRYSIAELFSVNRPELQLPRKVMEDIEIISRDCQENQSKKPQLEPPVIPMVRPSFVLKPNYRPVYFDQGYPPRKYAPQSTEFAVNRRPHNPNVNHASPPGINDFSAAPMQPVPSRRSFPSGEHHYQPGPLKNSPTTKDNGNGTGNKNEQEEEGEEEEWNQVVRPQSHRRISEHAHEMDHLTDQMKSHHIQKDHPTHPQQFQPIYPQYHHHHQQQQQQQQPLTSQAYQQYAPVAFPSHPMSPMLPSSLWYYRDFSGIDQGPFTNQQMTAWFRRGFFQPILGVRRADNPEYQPLHWLIAQNGGVAPFEVKQHVIPSKEQQPADTLILSMQKLDQHLEQQEALQKQNAEKNAMEGRMLMEEKKKLAMERQLLEEERQRIEMERQKIIEHEMEIEREREKEKEKEMERQRVEAAKHQILETALMEKAKEEAEARQQKYLEEQEKRKAEEKRKMDEKQKRDAAFIKTGNVKTLKTIMQEEEEEAEKQKKLRQQAMQQSNSQKQQQQQPAKSTNPWNKPNQPEPLSLAEIQQIKETTGNRRGAGGRETFEIAETHKKPIKMMETSIEAIKMVKVPEKSEPVAAWKESKNASSFWEILQEQKKPQGTTMAATSTSHKPMTMANIVAQHTPATSSSSSSFGVKTVIASHLLPHQQPQQQPSSKQQQQTTTKTSIKSDLNVKSPLLSPQAAFRQWCLQELSQVKNVDVPALLDFLMDLEVDGEVHDYVREYLDRMAPTQFANEFVKRRALLKRTKMAPKSVLTAAIVGPTIMPQTNHGIEGEEQENDGDYHTVSTRRHKKK